MDATNNKLGLDGLMNPGTVAPCALTSHSVRGRISNHDVPIKNVRHSAFSFDDNDIYKSGRVSSGKKRSISGTDSPLSGGDSNALGELRRASWAGPGSGIDQAPGIISSAPSTPTGQVGHSILEAHTDNMNPSEIMSESSDISPGSPVLNLSPSV